MLARRPPIPARKRLPFDVGTFLAKVGLPGTLLEYREGQIVFLQGDPAKDVFYIQKGGIKLMVLSHRGKEAVVATLIARDFFGEGCLAGQRLRVATATAIAPTTVLMIEKTRWFACFTKNTHSPTDSSPICWRETTESRRT